MMLDVHPLPVGTYWTSSPFGMRWGRLHAGEDLAAITGTPFHAVGPGVVWQAWDASGGGWWTRLDLDAGGFAGYGHADAYADPDGPGPAANYNGRHVPTGTVLGWVGNTGASSGPHLHFALAPNGVYVNPRPYLADADANNRHVGYRPPPLPTIEDIMTPEDREWITGALTAHRLATEATVGAWLNDTATKLAASDTVTDANMANVVHHYLDQLARRLDVGPLDPFTVNVHAGDLVNAGDVEPGGGE